MYSCRITRFCKGSLLINEPFASFLRLDMIMHKSLDLAKLLQVNDATMQSVQNFVFWQNQPYIGIFSHECKLALQRTTKNSWTQNGVERYRGNYGDWKRVLSHLNARNIF